MRDRIAPTTSGVPGVAVPSATHPPPPPSGIAALDFNALLRNAAGNDGARQSGVGVGVVPPLPPVRSDNDRRWELCQRRRMCSAICVLCARKKVYVVSAEDKAD